MNRRNLLMQFCAGATVAFLGAGPAFARDVTGEVVDQLLHLGYGKVSVSRTILGRVRITATRGKIQREIVLDPRSGEILRDLSSRNGRVGPLIREDNGSNSGRGSRSSGSDDDNDDNSGRGSSNSGSSNSGSDDDDDDDDRDDKDRDDDRDGDDSDDD
ncbi:MAG: hypothetical protein R3D53_03465 [Paracoccaceae bacterium]|jgi:hypothetical protein